MTLKNCQADGEPSALGNPPTRGAARPSPEWRIKRTVFTSGDIVILTYDEIVILHEAPPLGAETHHRSCALRLGGDSCTCL